MWTRVLGGWAVFADKLNRVDAINRELKDVQAQQAALSARHRLLTDEACSIRQGKLF